VVGALLGAAALYFFVNRTGSAQLTWGGLRRAYDVHTPLVEMQRVRP
jgi:hypothetical protein